MTKAKELSELASATTVTSGNVALSGGLGVTGVLTANGGAVFNEGDADVDFRVESANGQHTLFVEGSTGNIGMFGDATVQTIDDYTAYTTLTLGNTVGGTIQFEDDGATIGQVFNTANDLVLENTKADGDILIKGTDGGSSITALTFDMSAAGLAKFNAGIAIGGTGAANTLSDYEEGTWTPAVAGITGSSVAGLYTKVGNIVHFGMTFTMPSSSATTHLKFSGLPFAGANPNAFGGSLNYTESAVIDSIVIVVASAVQLYRASAAFATYANYSGRPLVISGSYKTAA